MESARRAKLERALRLRRSADEEGERRRGVGKGENGWSEWRDRAKGQRDGGDKQSLGRIPLGTKLCSPSRVNPPCRFYTPSSPRAFLAFSLSRLRKQHHTVSPCDSPHDAHRNALSYYLTRERERERERENTGSYRPANSQTALDFSILVTSSSRYYFGNVRRLNILTVPERVTRTDKFPWKQRINLIQKISLSLSLADS